MLKRNGQICQHSVPGYGGHLTDSEFDAYNAVFGTVEADFKELSGIADGISQLEQSLPQMLERISAPTNQRVPDAANLDWEAIAPLPGGGQSEMRWCKRRLGDLEEFAVAERYDPGSPLARAQGEFDVQLTDTDPLRLLRDFIDARREAAQLFANDIVATAQEQAAEKYPGQDLHRVLEAISHRCSKNIASGQAVSPAQAHGQGEGMHV